jgi:[ribosomal protein S5]-alanine N-acetyltransferase
LKTRKLLESSRLVLVASTAAHVRTELEAPEKLCLMLDATVSPAWPSGEYDRDAMEFFLSRFEEGGESVEGWYGWYALGPGRDGASRELVGAGGYFGPPGEDGTVEIGYSVLPEWQRQGYASEMVKTLVANAFTFPGVARVIAHTTADNPASIKVLLTNSFRAVGPGEEAGTLRFEYVTAIVTAGH